MPAPAVPEAEVALRSESLPPIDLPRADTAPAASASTAAPSIGEGPMPAPAEPGHVTSLEGDGAGVQPAPPTGAAAVPFSDQAAAEAGERGPSEHPTDPGPTSAAEPAAGPGPPVPYPSMPGLAPAMIAAPQATVAGRVETGLPGPAGIGSGSRLPDIPNVGTAHALETTQEPRQASEEQDAPTSLATTRETADLRSAVPAATVAEPLPTGNPSLPSQAAPAALAPGPARAPDAPPLAPSYPIVSGVPISAVPIEIGLRSLAGARRFDIRLAPEDLGAIEIAIDLTDGGEVTARLVVERPDTLAALQRDLPQLERALEQAGLKPSETSVALSLRDPSGDAAGGRGQGPDGGQRSASTLREQVGEVVDDPSPVPLRPATWSRAAGVDLRV